MSRIPEFKLGPFEDWAVRTYEQEYEEWELSDAIDEVDFDDWAEDNYPHIVDEWLRGQEG